MRDDQTRVLEILEGAAREAKESMEGNLSKPMSDSERFDTGWDLFFAGNRLQALSIATDLAQRDYMPAHMLLGLIYEYGGGGIDRDLMRAVASYQRIAIAIPSDVTYIYLARAHLKIRGAENIDRAKVYLTEAGKFRKSGALYLALGAYHECRRQWGDSSRYNLLALCYGRLLGMRRAADALAQAGYHPLAWLLRGLQLIVGLPLRILIGRRSLEDF